MVEWPLSAPDPLDALDAASKASKSLRESLRARARKARRELRASGVLSDWVIEYYTKRGDEQFLVSAEIAGVARKLAFLAHPGWYGKGSANEVELRLLPESSMVCEDVDCDVIAKRKRLGYMQTNNPVFVLRRIEETSGTTRLHIGIASYFEYICACGGVEEETMKVARHPFLPSPLRDRYQPDFATVAACTLPALGIGIHCLIVLHASSRNPRVVLQKRAEGVVTHAGLWGVIPAFAYQPLFRQPKEEFELLHQVLREFGEECLGMEELTWKNGRGSHSWFYRDEWIARMLSAHREGRWRLEITGFGFDGVNGEPNLAVLMRIEDPELSGLIESDLVPSWETEDMCVWTPDAPELRTLASDARMSPGAAFALSEGLARICT